MKFVTYLPETGEVKTWGSSDSPASGGAHGLLLEDAEGTAATHHVVSGVLVAYTDAQAATKAAVPDYPATWSNSAFAWIDSRSLDDAKADQWEAMKVARTEAITAGFTWDGSKFDADDVSQQRIQGAVQLAVLASAAGRSYSVGWTLFDNSTRVLSGSDMISVGLALGSFVAAAYATGVTLRLAIDAATTTDQVRSITWPQS